MKYCPSCSAEIDDKEPKCPICDYVFPSAEALEQKAELPEKEVSGLLADVKGRIQRLAGITPKEEPTEKPPATKVEEKAEKEPEAVEEIAEEIEAEQEGALTIEARPVKGDLNIPGISKKKEPAPKKPEKLGYKISAQPASHKNGRVLAAVAIVIVVMILFVSWYFLAATPALLKPVADGNFDEWKDVVKYESYIRSNNREMDFKETAVLYDEGSVFWYLSMNGTLFNSSSQTSPLMSTYSLFIDSDGNPETGFSLMQEFGADYVVAIPGSGHEKNSTLSKLYEFSGPDLLNWSSWEELGPIVVGSMGNRMEVSFQAPTEFNQTYARFVSISYDGASTLSATLPFSLTPGILLVQQIPLVSDNGIIVPGINQPILKVTLKGFGSALPIEDIHPIVGGISETYNLGSVDWNESQMKSGKSLIFSANTTLVPAGTFIKAEITTSSILSDYRSVVIIGEPARGYLSSTPGGIMIDGLFTDWQDWITDANDAVPVESSNIDLVQIGNVTTPTKTYFYADVVEMIFKGAMVPVDKVATSLAMPTSLWSDLRITGEDTLRIYLDTDPGSGIGANSPTNDSSIRPDLFVEICGKNGQITRENVEYWMGYWQANYTVGVNAVSVGRQLEVEISSIDLSVAKYVIIASDWKGNCDNMTGNL